MAQCLHQRHQRLSAHHCCKWCRPDASAHEWVQRRKSLQVIMFTKIAVNVIKLKLKFHPIWQWDCSVTSRSRTRSSVSHPVSDKIIEQSVHIVHTCTLHLAVWQIWPQIYFIFSICCIPNKSLLNDIHHFMCSVMLSTISVYDWGQLGVMQQIIIIIWLSHGWFILCDL